MWTVMVVVLSRDVTPHATSAQPSRASVQLTHRLSIVAQRKRARSLNAS